MSDNVASEPLYVELHSRSELNIRVPWGEPREGEPCIYLMPGGVDQHVDVNGAPLFGGDHTRKSTDSFRVALIPGSHVVAVCWSPRATVVIEGSDVLKKNVFVVEASPTAQAIAEYHCLINEQRQLCAADGGMTPPPSLLICGRDSFGKDTIALTLANYATRYGWTPLLVDLNPTSRQLVSLPGAIGAAVMEHPLHIGEDALSHAITVNYFLGSVSVQEPVTRAVSPIWQHYVALMFESIHKRVSAQIALGQSRGAHHTVHAVAGGSIIVAPELSGAEGVKAVKALMDSGKVTHVLCLHDDDLFAHIFKWLQEAEPEDKAAAHSATNRTGRRMFTLPNGLPIFLDRISGVAAIGRPESNYTDSQRMKQRFQSYFRGIGLNEIISFRCTKKFEEVVLLTFASGEGKEKLKPLTRSDFEGNRVKNCVAAIVDASSHGRKDACTVIAFGRIETTDAQTITFLSTLRPEAMPGGKTLTIILSESLQWLS